MSNIDKELRHAVEVVERIEKSCTDITSEYQDWLNVGLALASLGEEGRDLFHRVSALSPKYDAKECNEKFDNCLRTGKGMVTIATFMDIAKRCGVDVSRTKGRPHKSEEQQKKETGNKTEAILFHLNEYASFRYNTMKGRVEILEKEERITESDHENGKSVRKWRTLEDRDINTLYKRICESGINSTTNKINSLIDNHDFSKAYNPVQEYIYSLPKWKPGDTDYISEFFTGHLKFNDPENTDFYDKMLKKWFVASVGLWLDMIDVNPLMPVFCGPQHIGKTYFIMHILPPELREYMCPVNPSANVDKDFEISVSEFLIMFLDELSFKHNSNAFKYIITSTKSVKRDVFERNRKERKRKASLIAATNYKNYIKEAEGSRRYLSIDLAGTVNLSEHPLPYEGAYAQALYLLQNGYDPNPTYEESMLITEHNNDFMEPNDCEEAIRMLFRQPDGNGKCTAISAAEILERLHSHGFFGKGYNVFEVGRTMKQIGFCHKTLNGCKKYLVMPLDYDTLKSENDRDAVVILGEKTECNDNMPF